MKSEARWLGSSDPSEVVALLPRSVGERKRRLAACGCCRRIAYLCVSPATEAIDTTEAFADGQATHDRLVAARSALDDYLKAGAEYLPWSAASDNATDALRDVVAGVPGQEALAVEMSIEATGPESVSYFGTPEQAEAAAREYCAAVIRCIFGNPFRPAPFDPAWRTTAVVELSAGIYDDKAFDRLPVLADALVDAGCTDSAILAHCRQPGNHWRGCWVVDLVTGWG